MTLSHHRSLASSGANQDMPDVAANLRSLRRKGGYSLETLARLSGVSRAMLGQIETGKSVPTVTVIWKVARALGVTAASLIASQLRVPLMVVRAGEVRSVSTSGGKFVQRHFHSADALFPFDFSEIAIESGHCQLFSPLTVGGRATLVVKAGVIEANIGDEPPLQLCAGDALLFQADVTHSLSNPAATTTTAFLVSSPPRSLPV